MKILNAICFQNIGGVGQVFRDYSKVLQDNGHEVALLISDKYLDDYQEDKIFKLKHISPVFDCFHIAWIMLRFKPDVVFCHSPRAMKLVRFLKIFPAVKTFGINHGATFRHAKGCDYAINVNAQINQDLVNSGFDSGKSFVIQNGVHVTEKYRAKELNNIPVIGIYGRVEIAKGFDILIKAAGELRKENIDFRLKIGGFEVSDHCNFQDLKDLAKAEGVLEKCDFVGLVKDKKEFFKNVDIFCVASRHESFGMVILEGFLFSTLVISSKTHGGEFLIKDGENGLLFENENPLDLVQKIKYLLQNPSIYQAMTQKAFLRLEKDFSFDSLGKEIERAINVATKK
jgi:glycosyltransferase involved in cell wall biosynthesis